MQVPHLRPQAVRGSVGSEDLVAAQSDRAHASLTSPSRLLVVERQHPHAAKEETAKHVHARVIVERDDRTRTQHEDAQGHLRAGVDILVTNASSAADPGSIRRAKCKILWAKLVQVFAKACCQLRRQLARGPSQRVPLFPQELEQRRRGRARCCCGRPSPGPCARVAAVTTSDCHGCSDGSTSSPAVLLVSATSPWKPSAPVRWRQRKEGPRHAGLSRRDEGTPRHHA
mmetsp:Transcript_44441/g.102719  ORF Transcript_44441/g.102719 Transcript_44441/m.102719 type:complete len:228 (+) Transcript_44441:390-1073(+)